ncbi:MAG: HigA family addiction module antidote protein [Treponema sp.]|jgi:addiction module HigA family antidote|nr:HigA family addiction module antidote protein [Treponema sp.]
MKKQAVLQPGTVLKESFLDAYQISVAQLAEDIGISSSAVRQIISNKAKISLHIALRLSKYFGTEKSYWVDLQNTYDLSELSKDVELAEIVKQIHKAKKPAPSKQVDKPARGRKAAADAVTPPIRKRRTRKTTQEES